MRYRLILLLMVGLFVLSGSGEYRENAGETPIAVTTDSAGDSTISSGVIGLGKVGGFSQSIMALFIMPPARSAYAGLGNADSCELVFWTSFGNRRETLGTANCAGLPCSLYYASTATALDTLLKTEIGLDYTIVDTLGDTAIDVVYWLKRNVILK